MCPSHSPKKSWVFSAQTLILLALVLGVFCGFFPFPQQKEIAKSILEIFTNTLKLLSFPVIFLALLTSLTGVDQIEKCKWIATRILFWAALTTLLAAAIALLLFIVIDPVRIINRELGGFSAGAPSASYWNHLLHLVPKHVFEPFMEGNVIGILLLAVALGIALMKIPGREKVHAVLSPLMSALMQIVRWVVAMIPLAVWAGIVASFDQLLHGPALEQIALYLLVVICANLLQGIVIIPVLLKLRGIAPWRHFRQFFPALSVAFFSKSSVATLPIAMRTAEERLGVSPTLSRFAFPLCTTINMNGCAAFILSTVLFVAMSQGAVFSFGEMIGWVFIASLTALGNAGVPMGCFFLSAALLAAMNVPLELMGVILPFYSLIDMIETALNVWSDGAVVLIVSKQSEEPLLTN